MTALIKYGKEIGYKTTNKYIWSACEQCGEERWVRLRRGKPEHPCCYRCTRVFPEWYQSGHGSYRAEGYVLVYSPEHPQSQQVGGYIRRARLVLEQKLGRPIKPGCVVHHINSIKDDDSPDNLVELTVLEHHQIHKRDTVGRYIKTS